MILTLIYSAATLRLTKILVCLDQCKTRRPENVKFLDVKVTTVAIRTKINRSFRFAYQWGVQFYGDNFDFLIFYQTDDSFDIYLIHIGRGHNVFDIDFHDSCFRHGPLVTCQCTVDER